MAKFTFELTDKRYFYSATKDKSMQRFMFASKVASGYTVEIKNNGQLATGDVTFFEIGDDSSKIYQGKISYGERTKNEPHIFSVNAYLPTTIFQNLFRINLEQVSIYLTFSTNIQAYLAGESSVSYGHVTGETIWDVEKESTVTAESICLTVIYKTASQSSQKSDLQKKEDIRIANTLVTDKLDELINAISCNNQNLIQTVFHQLRDSLLPTSSNSSVNHEASVESTQKIYRLLNRIFLAIVVVGGLVALNLLSANIH